MDTVIELLKITKEKDNRGVWREKLTPREVFAQVHSVTRNEFFDGGRNGLNPEFQFTVFHGDYYGESQLKYLGKNYAIYRTFIQRNSDYIELYAERQGGTNG